MYIALGLLVWKFGHVLMDVAAGGAKPLLLEVFWSFYWATTQCSSAVWCFDTTSWILPVATDFPTYSSESCWRLGLHR